MATTSASASTPAPASGDITRDALRYETLDLELQGLAAKVRALKKEQAVVGQSILQHCLSTDKDKVSTDTMNLLVSQSVGQASLSVPLLRTVFLSFFARRPDIAEKLISAIQKHRREAAPDRVRLKRVMRREGTS